MNEEHGQLGFYRFIGQMLVERKAYLSIKDPSVAPIKMRFEEGEATGIHDVDLRHDNASDGYYTIDGRHFNGTPTKNGLYILNGRKVMITGRTER